MSTTLQSSSAAELVRAPLLVDVVSDVVCPWCYIGKRKLETALSRLLENKFGGKARAAEIYARVRAVGEEVGIAFAFDRIARQPNTRDAHRLLAWAQQRSDAGALVERLFRAYFIEGVWIGERKLLAALAADCGLPREEAQAALASDACRAEVEAEYREAQEAGITGVPFFIFNGRTAVSGAHDPDALLEAIAAARANA
ncbi:MAG: DsbA family oxidoreductase [Betaproteobacteria bacterium]|nr:MAG: DsbA family oxidoreductase [Betaproteobacteria bacterium]